jgi:ABC-type transport system substrate-binding protein
MGLKVKISLLAAVLVLTVGLLVAATATTQEAVRVYNMAMHEDMTTTSYINYLGPGASVWNAYVLGNMHPGLYSLADVTFQPILGLADDYASPIVKEGDFYTSEICITPGNMWTDGTEITAEDVAFSYNGILELDPIQLGGNWPAIIDPDFIDHVDVTSNYCVKFYMPAKPGLARWEYGLLGAPILQKAYWGPKFENALASADPVTTILAEPGTDEPSGTAFYFGTWEPGAFASIERSYVTAPKELEGLSRVLECESGFYGSAGVSAAAGGGYVGSLYVVAGNDGEYNAIKGLEGTLKAGDLASYKYNDAFRALMIRTNVSDDYNALWGYVSNGLSAIESAIGCNATLDYAPGPYIDRVIYKLYGTMSAAALAVISGDVDYHLNPLGYELGLRQQLEAAEGVEVIVNPSNGFYYLSWNMRKAPFNNLYFRKAIDCVIDREYVTEQLLQGVAYPGYTPVPPGNGYWYRPPSEEEKEARCVGFSEAEKIARAVEYLKEGGFTWQQEPQVNPDGTITPGKGIMLNGELIPEIELIHPNAAYDNRRNIFGLHVAKRANTLGIPIRSVPTGFNVIVSRVFIEQDFDMWELGWGLGIYPDYLKDFFSSEESVPGGFNPQGYNNPEYDALADAFVAEQDLTKAHDLAIEMQEFLAQDLPYAVLFYSPTYEAYRSDKVKYPYTETLDGLQTLNGLPGSVKLLQ